MAKNNESAAVKAVTDKDVSEVLRKIGVPSNLIGFGYIKAAIILICSDTNEYMAVTKVLYPAIAKQFGVNTSKVERAIRTAIVRAFDYTNPKVIDEIFGNAYDSEKGNPTNSEFLFTVAEYLKYKAEDENNE